MKARKLLIFAAVALMLLSACPVWGRWRTFRICELNTENLFDTTHDEGKQDQEFLPDGKMRWTMKKLWKKLENLSKELISVGPNRPADLIALTEVENDSVMTWLCRRALLRKSGYRYIMTDSPDARGIDVALMYQPATFKPLKSTYIRVNNPHARDFRTRDILHVEGRLQSGDTLHVFVCHLSSKRGGKYSQRDRDIECAHLRRGVDNVFRRNPDANIVILGDFNDVPTSPALVGTLRAALVSGDGVRGESRRLYNLSPGHETSRGIRGTYKYEGTWEMLDQCIVSGALLRSGARVSTSHSSLRIWAPSFVLEDDKSDLLQKPRRTYKGYRYNGGFSDHLPIFIDLRLSF